MKPINPNAVNNVNFSGSAARDLSFSVCWMSYSCKDNAYMLTCRNHHHAFFELHFILAGQVDYGVVEKNISVKAGEVILISPKCQHRVSGYSDDFAKFTVAFNLFDGSPMGESFSSRPYRVCKMGEGLLAEVEHLLALAERRGQYRNERVELTAKSVVLGVTEILFGMSAQSKEEKSDDRVIKAKTFIDDNCDIFFTCEEVARYCHVSAKQLGRLFKKYEGYGLLEYIHAKKLETAKRMISEFDLPKKKMAELLGFSDANYFCKFFRRMTGETPKEYKKRIK